MNQGRANAAAVVALIRHDDRRSLELFAADLQDTPATIQADMLGNLMVMGMIELPLRYRLMGAVIGRSRFARRLGDYFNNKAPNGRAANWATFLHHLVHGEADGDDGTSQGGYNRKELAAILWLFEAYGYVATEEMQEHARQMGG